MSTYHHIHFTGIKGVGMSALAIIAKEAGCLVTGSDIAEEFITDYTLDMHGIHLFTGFSEEHIESADLVVYSGAHKGHDNTEVRIANKKGIKTISYARAVGMMMDGTLFNRKFQGISIAGTHGKTTTSAMLSTVLKKANLDPSYIIGTSNIIPLGASGHYGKGKFFVLEADEYASDPVYDKNPKFYYQHPQYIVITSIEHDHPDIYPDLNSLKKVFKEFIDASPSSGLLVVNGDDPVLKEITRGYKKRFITYGLEISNDYFISNIRSIPASKDHIINSKDPGLSTAFQINNKKNNESYDISLSVSGEHNCLNACASVIISLEIGLDITQIQKGLLDFSGTARRMQYAGRLPAGALLYDDYAHHPTEIQATLKALKSMYPDRKIVCVFQPHTASRTKALFNGFVNSFGDCDELVLVDIYASLRENTDPSVSSLGLSDEIRKIKPNVNYLPYLKDVVQYIKSQDYNKDYILVTMGAGDVYKIIQELKPEA